MKVAYISHHGRPCYEYSWFANLPFEKVKFLDVDFSAYPSEHADNIEYCKVQYSENKLLKGRFHSTASMIEYHGFENHLKDVDVIIVLEVFSSLSKQFVKYAKSRSIKSAVIVYELIPTHPLHYLPTHYLNRTYTINNVDAFICVSHKAADSLLKLGADTSKIEVVYPGIDLNLFKPDSPRIYGNDILFIGGLKVHKGIDMFLELADAVMPLFPDVKFGVIGDGTFKAQVIEYEKKYPGFTYYGRLKNDQLPKVLNQYSIYVMPCREMSKYGIKITAEQFGFSFVEAMACGLAIVTTKCGAIPEIVTNTNSICPQSKLSALVDAVTKLLVNPGIIAKTGEKNATYATLHYNIKTQGAALGDKLRSITNVER